MTEPQMIRLELPVDTITQTANRVLLALLATNDGTIAHHLVLQADTGCYKFRLTDQVAASLMAQFQAHNEFGKQLQREQQGEQ